ncbi:MAG TPA: hypothetical protein VNF68_01875 [Candidatus Baltobacteraceae bacterium]|nr:hypothetical protein [Candidatus Baltobacteraceae bacterium]
MRAVSRDERISKALETRDDRSLTPREQSLIGFARQLTVRPHEVRDGDVEALRLQGLDDEAILHATQIVAYFNFVNRLALGLGVQLETSP